MNKPLSGRVALVTGASSGIGEATARALAAAGANVAITARRGERLSMLAEEIKKTGGRVLKIAADLVVEEENRRIVIETEARFGRLDILVNNAGVMLLAPFGSDPSEAHRLMVQTNLIGAMTATEIFLEQLRDRGRRDA